MTEFESTGDRFLPFRDDVGNKYEASFWNPEHVAFGPISHRFLDQQSQYGSRYIDGMIDGYPALGIGLRISGDTKEYHEIGIHPEDVDEFVGRVYAYRAVVYGWVMDTDEHGARRQRRATEAEVIAGEEFLTERGITTP